MGLNDRWSYIINLDEELLLGGVMLSEWSTFLIKDTDEAFCAGANLASILAAQAAIESHLRYEYVSNQSTRKLGFYELIEQAPLHSDLKRELHAIRRYRNRWVHVNDPSDDEDLHKSFSCGGATPPRMKMGILDLNRCATAQGRFLSGAASLPKV